VSFIDKAKGFSTSATVRCNSNFSFSTALPPGTYEVRLGDASYSDEAGLTLSPVDVLVNSALSVSGPMSGLVVNETVSTVSGVVRVNGATPALAVPTYCTQSNNLTDPIVEVVLRDAAKGYYGSAYVRCNSNFGFSALLPAGIYEVSLRIYNSGPGINLVESSYTAIAHLAVP
jgi:hypothetical protein